MATHSSVLAWRIPGMGEPGGLPSLGSHRVGHDWSNLAAAAAHASKVMLKILQARLQQYMNREIPDVQAGFRKGRGTRDHIANIRWKFRKAREFQKNIYFCFIDYAKAFDCVDHNKLWKIQKEMRIPDHLICLLRNLYADQEATVRPGHGTTDWFQIGKGVCQGCILSPCLFNFYAEYIMRNAGLVRLPSRALGLKVLSLIYPVLFFTGDLNSRHHHRGELSRWHLLLFSLIFLDS